MKSLTALITLTLCFQVSSCLVAQRTTFVEDANGGISDIRVIGGGIGDSWIPGSGSGKFDPLSLLDNKDVREELEFVDDQLDEFRAAQDEFRAAQDELRQQILDRAKSLAGAGKLDPSQMSEIAKELAKLKKGSQKSLESMLLPHQLERLRQVALQIQMKKRGAANTLISGKIAEELGIDAAQKKRIENRQEELEEELDRRMEELKKEIRDKLLDEMTSEQKRKLEKLFGDDFEYKQNSIHDRIQQQFNRRKSKLGG